MKLFTLIVLMSAALYSNAIAALVHESKSADCQAVAMLKSGDRSASVAATAIKQAGSTQTAK